jgi:transposase-like protein
MSYPKIIKEAALEKMFHTDLSLRYIADELGIPRATLHGWKRQYQMIKNDSEAIEIPAESWTPEEKFSVVLESATLSEVEETTDRAEQ